VFFRLSLKEASQDTDHMLQEFLLLMWQRFTCWLVDQQIPFATTQFSYPPPPHVADVSERVGFSETASFCRAFKRWTGKSPSQWPG
jgi:AraC-like DNA-binding protein